MEQEKPKIGWKILKKGMYSNYNKFKWRKNKWYKHEGEIKLCEAGFHASKELVSAMNYLIPGIIAKIEYKGRVREQEDKFVASEMRVIKTYRFTKRMAVEWSVYCAKQSLKTWNKYNKEDKRPLRAIQVAEKWLSDPTKENKDLARSAARAAVESARSAKFARLAAGSAWSAAKSVVELSERSAVESAMYSVESAWSSVESERLKVKLKLHKKLLKIIGEK